MLRNLRKRRRGRSLLITLPPHEARRITANIAKLPEPLREERGFHLSFPQYSSASMIVITRWVIVGSAGSSECQFRVGSK